MSNPFTDIEIHPIQDDTGRHIVAVANATVGEIVRLTGIRVAHRPGEGPRLILPSRETGARGVIDFFYPIGAVARYDLDQAILGAYERARRTGFQK